MKKHIFRHGLLSVLFVGLMICSSSMEAKPIFELHKKNKGIFGYNNTQWDRGEKDVGETNSHGAVEELVSNANNTFTYVDSSVKLIAKYETTDHIIKYIGDESTADSTKTEFEIFHKSKKKVILSFSYNVDKSKTDYKLYVRNSLVGIADLKLTQAALSKTLIQNITNEMDGFLGELKKVSGQQYFSKERYNGFNFPFSIISMMNRATIDNETSCECNTPALYFEEDAAFQCTQDILFDVSKVEDFFHYVDTIVYADSLSGVDSTMFIGLSNHSSGIITYEEVMQLMVLSPDFSNRINPIPQALVLCWPLSGSTPGCCGSYSGPCWFCLVACLIHDLNCWCCDSDVVPCGGGCVSEC